MSVNVKLGDNIINGVSTVKLESATTPGTYENFVLSDGVSMNDVNFYDYDGTRVASYSAADFANLSAMPANPAHAGLTAQGWNWTLSDAKAYVAANGMLDIGQMYITDDGKTRLYINIDNDMPLELVGTVGVNFYINGGVVTNNPDVIIDWGDGSQTESYSGDGQYGLTHTYASSGDYIITVQVNTQNGIVLGDASNYTPAIMIPLALQKVELGEFVDLGNGSFSTCSCLNSISMRNGISEIGGSSFSECHNLKSITIPSSVESINDYAFSKCVSLSSASIPNSATMVGENAFSTCVSLKRACLPALTLIPEVYGGPWYAFGGCAALQNVVIPNGTDIIATSEFSACYSAEVFKIPLSIETISANAFEECYKVKIFDFTSHSFIPELANGNAFPSGPALFKILVPGTLYNDWINATNWSGWSYCIVPVGEVPDNGGGDVSY